MPIIRVLTRCINTSELGYTEVVDKGIGFLSVIMGVTGFDRVCLRWEASRGLLVTLNRGSVKNELTTIILLRALPSLPN